MWRCTEHRSYQENTELVQNVIVTINNLSFYQVTDNYVTKSAVQISQCKCVIAAKSYFNKSSYVV